MLNDVLRQTGVGALPLLPPPSDAPLDPEQIMNEKLSPGTIMRDTTMLYERFKWRQDSAANVANLLGAVGVVNTAGATTSGR